MSKLSISLKLGTDIIEIERIATAIKKNKHFCERIYTPAEIAYCENKKQNKYASYAGIYAAKEAFFKALGTGFRRGSWHEIEITHDELGAPQIILKGTFAKVLEEINKEQIVLSISHCKTYAISQVILT